VDNPVLLARLSKGPRREIRVIRSDYADRDHVDFRLWVTPKEGGEARPTTKGCSIEASQLPALIAALNAGLKLAGKLRPVPPPGPDEL
jgi:hypothetical protein